MKTVFMMLLIAGCAGAPGEVPIPELNCPKDPCDTDPALLCPPNDAGDIYVRDYDTCTCTCTKPYPNAKGAPR